MNCLIGIVAGLPDGVPKQRIQRVRHSHGSVVGEITESGKSTWRNYINPCGVILDYKPDLAEPVVNGDMALDAKPPTSPQLSTRKPRHHGQSPQVSYPKDMPHQLSPYEKDRLIVTLRRRGWTLHRIGKATGLSTSGAKRALDRIAEGRDTPYSSSV